MNTTIKFLTQMALAGHNVIIEGNRLSYTQLKSIQNTVVTVSVTRSLKNTYTVIEQSI
jgi:hypothetical protein